MSVYVDDMKASYGQMIMCHMVADTTGELIAMANLIHLNPKWLQCQGTYKEHFDICKSKRELAIKYGAMPISQMDLVRKIQSKRQAL